MATAAAITFDQETPQISKASAYIPIDRQLAMAGLLDLTERTWGAALFADISGFTPLTEALANELGPKRGAEELTRQLDSVYSAIIAEVHRYRGTVIGFAGDAITCWFDKDEGLRAAACGQAMQRSMLAFEHVRTPTGTTIALGLKVAIASGPTRRLLVGDPGIQLIDILAGSTLDRMAEAEHHAQTGEVVVTPEIATRFAGKIEVSEWRAPGYESDSEATGELDERCAAAVVRCLVAEVAGESWPEMPSGSLVEEQVRPWILPELYERVRRDEGIYLSEMRLVVPLFLRFSGIAFDDDPSAGEKLDAYIRWVQGVLSRRGGSLLQVIIGDKGCVLYAVFGAPVAHDDDAVRAVATALELRATPSHLSYISSVQIGIARGRTHAGPFGAPTRRTYGLLGDDVNLSARLMAAAEPGQIMVSRRVAEAASRHFGMQVLEPIWVKGKKEPVSVALVLGWRTHIGTASLASWGSKVLVGRDRELSVMSEARDRAAKGQGQILRLEGPAGVGKSHLAAEVMQRAVAQGVGVLHGACLSGAQGATGAYTPWRPVARALFGLPEEPGSLAEGKDQTLRLDNEIEVVQRFTAETNPGWALRLPLLGDLLNLPIPDNATTAGFEPKLRQSALFDLLADAAQTVARARPLLIAIDDVQWMDKASQGLTLAVGRAISQARVLLLLISRPPLQDEQILPAIEALPIHRRLSVEELPPEAVAALVHERLSGKADELALSMISRIAQGNPFFTEEVVRSMKESGGLQLDSEGCWALSDQLVATLRKAECLIWLDGKWQLAAGAAFAAADLGLPDTVETAVLSRLDHLPDGPKLTLKVASAVGMSFPLDLLAEAHPMRHPESLLLEHITSLAAEGFIYEETQAPRPVHAFHHNVTHDVVYGTLLHEQARQLHWAVGQALEKLNPEATTQLAYHTFLGEDWQRALAYQELAARQAQKLFANFDGIEHLNKALYAVGQLPQEAQVADERQQIELNLGMMLTYTGQYDSALEHLHAALDLAQEREERARVCRWIGYLYEYRGKMEEALTWIERGLQVLGDEESTAASELLAIAGLICTRIGDFDRAFEACDRGIRVAESLGDRTALAFACNSRGVASARRGDNADAIAHSSRSLELYRQVENVHGAAMAGNQLANIYFATGRWAEADRYYREARDVFVQTGDLLHQMFADNNMGGIARDQGRLDDALQYYGAAMRATEQLGGSPWAVGGLHINLGATLVRRGDAEAARRHTAASLEVLTRGNIRGYLSEAHRVAASTALLAGELDEAEREAELAVGLARELTIRGDEGCVLRVLGEVIAARGDMDKAEQLLRESLAVLEEVGDRFQLATSQLALSRVLAKAGRADEATPLLDSATRVFADLEARLDLASARELQSTLVAQHR